MSEAGAAAVPVKASKVRLFAAIGFVGILVLAGYLYWRHSVLYPATDDAFVQAHVVQVAAQITGPVQKVYVVENQRVSAGQPLFDIDPAPFELAVTVAQAQLDKAAQSVGAGAADVQAATAASRQQSAALENTRVSLERTRELFRKGDIAKARMDDAQASFDEASAALDATKANLERARQQLGVSGDRNASLRAATAAVQQAQLNLSYTHIVAPADGWIANLTLREGTMVGAGVSQFSLVETGTWWVDANFKETDLTRLRQGQSAKVTIDMYPDLALDGVVESLSAGSGAVFSLLPPENATSNWVKVTQRFTVRIALPELPVGPARPLRIGASASVTVDATDAVR